MNVINGAATKCEMRRLMVDTCEQIAIVIITVQTFLMVF